MNRIQSLDGLRALSISMVLLGHASASLPSELINNIVFKLFANAKLGVVIFFVISGYLITKLLIKEKKEKGYINIKQFYVRRGFRILPVFYLYIVVLLLLKVTIIPEIIKEYSDIVPATIYLWNYKHLWTETLGKGNWFLGHFWSLCMEEQFYLIWPILFGTYYLKVSDNKFMLIVLALILLMPISRVATYFFLPESRGQLVMMLHTGGDAILVGCFGALLETTTIFQSKYKEYLKNKFLISFCLLLLFIISPLLKMHFRGAYGLTIGMSLNNVLILFFLFWSIYVPTKFSQLLNNKIVIQVGLLSYSLYVWQQLFLTNKIGFWINKFPQNIFLVFIVGLVSYYFIEKPILKLKNKLNAQPNPKAAKEVVEVGSLKSRTSLAIPLK